MCSFSMRRSLGIFYGRPYEYHYCKHYYRFQTINATFTCQRESLWHTAERILLLQDQVTKIGKYAHASAKQIEVVQKLEDTLMRQQNSTHGPNINPEHTINSVKYKRLNDRNKQLHAKLTKISRISNKGGDKYAKTSDPVKAELSRVLAENERLAEANMISRTGGAMKDEVCLLFELCTDASLVC